MFSSSHILFPTDFSHYAMNAMKYAVAIAKAFEGEVHVVHVLDPALFNVGGSHGAWLTRSDAESLEKTMRSKAETRLEHLVQRIAEEGVKAHSHIAFDKPARGIIALSEELECDMVVIATHGRTGFDHLVFGSVAEQVVRRSQAPVLSVKHAVHDFVSDGSLELNVSRILFPTDFSESADHALPYAASLCRELGASLILFHAAELPVVLPEFMPDSAATVGADMQALAHESLERQKEAWSGIPVETEVSPGVPYREICAAVERLNVDLIVLPTHGHSGLGHALFGSVAAKVVRRASCPVLTIRPGNSGSQRKK